MARKWKGDLSARVARPSKRKPAQPYRPWQAGFSLIELMVATLVFSIGILGAAGLNAVSKRSGYEAVQRSVASQLAFALLEEIRSNREAIDVYIAAGTLGSASQGVAIPANTCANAASPCTPAQLATYRLWEWERVLDGALEQAGGVNTGGLVSPSACITGPAIGAGVFTVTVVWRGQTELADQGLNNCGAASGLYGANNEFRRIVFLPTFLDPAY